MGYRSQNPEGESTNNLSIWNDLDYSPDLSQQFQMLNSISNFHFWPWSGNVRRQVLLQERLPNTTRFYPGSPRHRILQAIHYRPNAAKIVFDVLMNITGCNVEVRYEKTQKRKVT